MAWVGLVDPATQKVCPVTHTGIEDNYLQNICISITDTPEGFGPTGRAIREGHCVACSNIVTDRAWFHGVKKPCAGLQLICRGPYQRK